MDKWLSDNELLDTASEVYDGTLDVGKLLRVCAQAKEANRLRTGLERIRNEAANRLKYYNEKANQAASQNDAEESAFWFGKADVEEDITEDLRKLLEGEK